MHAGFLKHGGDGGGGGLNDEAGGNSQYYCDKSQWLLSLSSHTSGCGSNNRHRGSLWPEAPPKERAFNWEFKRV